VNPAAGRTAGSVSTVYSFHIENRTGGQIWAWLEIGAVEVTARFPVANNNSLTIDFPAGANFGNQDLDINADVAGVLGQVFGTEV